MSSVLALRALAGRPPAKKKHQVREKAKFVFKMICKQIPNELRVYEKLKTSKNIADVKMSGGPRRRGAAAQSETQ